jgi:hypothetical protein
MATPRAQALKSKIDKACEGHYYIHVFKKDGKMKTSHIKLSGYNQMFKKDPAFMYVRSLRHAGVDNDIIEYLVDNGFDNSQSRAYLRDSYNAETYESHQSEIDAELDAIPRVEKEKKEAVSLDRIISVKHMLESVKAAAGESNEIPAVATPKLRGTKVDLKSRLTALDDGMVLDITHFDLLKKTGIKTTKRTSKGTRRPLASSGLLERIVYNFAKGPEVAIHALVSMGMTTDEASAAYSAATTTKTADLSKVAVPGRK